MDWSQYEYLYFITINQSWSQCGSLGYDRFYLILTDLDVAVGKLYELVTDSAVIVKVVLTCVQLY